MVEEVFLATQTTDISLSHVIEVDSHFASKSEFVISGICRLINGTESCNTKMNFKNT